MVSAQQEKNRFLLCLNSNESPVDVSNLVFNDEQINSKPDLVYFGKILEYVKNNLKLSGLTFYITWDVKQLPSYGKDIVAIVIGDEWCRVPSYFHRVKATFKTHGVNAEFGFQHSHDSAEIMLLNILQSIRITLLRLPGVLNKAVHSGFKRSSPIYDIPIGYFQQLDLPIKDITSREIDVFFAGSINHRKESSLSLKKWLGGPKTASRRVMMQYIRGIKSRHPELTIELLETSSFSHSVQVGKEIYSRNMMNSRITLVPRGASLETLRFFESIRYGCIPITEHLPSRWFYDGTPTIKISNWKDLEKTILNLLSDQESLIKAHKDALQWWESRCSEEAVGRYIVQILDS